MNIILSKKNK